MTRSRRGRRQRAVRPRPRRSSQPGARAGWAAAGSTRGRHGWRSSPPVATDDAAALPWLERWFIPAAIGILLVAAALRLPELGINPFHHDEGVNGWFTTNLVRSGRYFYDPQNYHGPSLYYAALLSEILFGLTDTAMRLVPVVFGLATVAIVLAMRPVIGTVAALVAGGLLAVSPGMVYISRYFIHEMLLVAGTVGLVATALLYLRTGKPAFVILGAVALALMATTKESWIITLGVLGIAAVASGVYVNVRAGKPPFGSPGPTKATSPKKKPRSIWVDGVEYRASEAPEAPEGAGPTWTAGRGIQAELVAAAVIVFLCVYVLLFTSFFTNFPNGLTDSVSALFNWAETGGQTQIQPIYQYLEWMARADAPILILGTIGGLIAAIRGRDRLWVFIGLWALGITLAYSLVSYKTPWIAVNMLLPLGLLAGFAIREILRMRGPVRLVAPLALVVAAGWSTYQAIDLDFTHYDDEKYPYVFVHSTRQTFDLLDEIEAKGAQLGTGDQTGISVVSPDYWPLPWYLRDNPNAAFWGYLQNESTNNLDTPQPLVVSNVNQRADVEAAIADTHTRVGTYTLRPGVELDLWVQSNAAGG